MSEYLKIGKCVKTQGLKGEIRVYPYINNLDDYLDFDVLFLGMQKSEYSVAKCRLSKNIVIYKLDSIDHIDDAEQLIGQEVFIQENELEDETYYVKDLIGLTVFDTDNNEIGEIINVLSNTAQNIFEVRKLNGEKALVPGVKEFFKDVDLEKKRITIITIDGLL